MTGSSGLDDRRIPQTLRQLESNRPPIVAKAAQQLMKLAPGDPRLEEVLCRRLNDPCLRVRAIVANALGELKAAKRKQPGAAAIPIRAINLAGSSFQVNACPSYNVWAFKELLAQMVDTKPANLIVMQGTLILEDTWVLKDHLTQEDFEVSFAVSSEVNPKQDVSVNLLLQRLEDKSEQSKLAALQALMQLAPDSDNLVDPLLQCLEREFGCHCSGGLTIAVAAAEFLSHLAPGNLSFTNILMNGFWQELRKNLRFFAQQQDPLDRIQPLSTLAEILVTIAPDSEYACDLVRYFFVYRLRVLGHAPRTRSMSAKLIEQLEVGDPRTKEALHKLFQRDLDIECLMSSVRYAMQMSLNDLRMVGDVLTPQGHHGKKKRDQAVSSSQTSNLPMCGQTLPLEKNELEILQQHSEGEVPESWDT